MSLRFRLLLLLVVCCLAAPVALTVLSLADAIPAQAAAEPASADLQPLPFALTRQVRPLAAVARVTAPAVDREAVRRQDAEREDQGLPPRFAIANPVSLSPRTDGTWEVLADGRLMWRLRITSPGALSLNLGFSRYRLPAGGHLFVYAADVTADAFIDSATGATAGAAPAATATLLRHFTDRDNEDHGELWTPIVLADDIVVEVTVPASERDRLQLELTSINVGYRFFGQEGEKSGACNVDVVCPEGDDWREEIQGVAVISRGGNTICTGFLVNNTAQDQVPYFMTANHCQIDLSNAASLVVYWNFFSPNCGDQGGGSLDQFQTGSVWRAGYIDSDFTLVELDDDPDPAFDVTFLGWDRSEADPTSAVTIHHPGTDEKSISFENQPVTTTSYLQPVSPGDGTHLRVADWDVGTTEPGSSGCPLFNQDHRVVGQLHGGYAACGNDDPDWFGRFSVSWQGGGTDDSGLSHWLDPLGTGAVTLGHLVSGAAALRVTPYVGLESAGEVGGPFSPASLVFTLENRGTESLQYQITTQTTWIQVSPPSGTLPGGSASEVIVSIDSAAEQLARGIYRDTLTFQNITNHAGDTTRALALRVGPPQLFHSFPLSADPGWSTSGQWAFGPPTGGGGAAGGPDPTAGYTGPYVYGYNLAGDYPGNLPRQPLTSTALDCSGIEGATLRFRRWLGVQDSAHDEASVSVSNNGSTFTTVWTNSGPITDNEWVLQELDISAVADLQPAVNLRWNMGPTDAIFQYCGWNIDDIEIWGYESANPTPPVITRLLRSYPNPFNQRAYLPFDLHVPGRVRLAIYDVRGRLIKIVHDGQLAADRYTGDNSFWWDGTDRHGQIVASGAYLVRLQAGGLRREGKVLFLR